MWNSFVLIFGTFSLFMVVFGVHPTPRKILSASRWLLLAWGFLSLAHLLSPYTQYVYKITTGTLLYCAIWLGAFIVSENIGFRYFWQKISNKRGKTSLFLISKRQMTILLGLAVVGATYILARGPAASIDLATTDSWFADVRRSQLSGVGQGILFTLAVVCSSFGILVSLISTSSAIMRNERPGWLTGIGLAAYLATYVLTGGRFGFMIAAVSGVVVVWSSLELAQKPYRHYGFLGIVALLGLLCAAAYVGAVGAGRTLGWGGTLENKVGYIALLTGSAYDYSVVAFLERLGVFGSFISELFNNFSNQIYGLDHSIRNYNGPLGLGAVQFPYISRRIEQVFGIDLLQSVNFADQNSYLAFGVAPNFFRTAIQTTMMDFGLFFAIPFVALCGLLAGRSLASTVRTKSSEMLAIQGLICAGATFTIIYSPFIEQGWAFPVILWLLLKALSNLWQSTGVTRSVSSRSFTIIGTIMIKNKYRRDLS